MARIITECQSSWIFSVCVPLCWVSRVRIYRCFLFPSSRWHLLNGSIISESITSLLGVKWEDTLSMVWKFIIDFVTLRHWWRGDGLILTRWLIQSCTNHGVILVHRWTNIYQGLSVAPLFQGRPYLGQTLEYDEFFFFWKRLRRLEFYSHINCFVAAWHASWPHVLFWWVSGSCFRWGPFQFSCIFQGKNFLTFCLSFLISLLSLCVRFL